MFPVWLCRCTLPPAVCLQGELYFKTAAKAELRAERWGGGGGKKEKRSYLGQIQAHLPDNPSLRPTAVDTYLRCSRCRTKGWASPAPATSAWLRQQMFSCGRCSAAGPRQGGTLHSMHRGYVESTDCHTACLRLLHSAWGSAGPSHHIWDGAQLASPGPGRCSYHFCVLLALVPP